MRPVPRLRRLRPSHQLRRDEPAPPPRQARTRTTSPTTSRSRIRPLQVSLVQTRPPQGPPHHASVSPLASSVPPPLPDSLTLLPASSPGPSPDPSPSPSPTPPRPNLRLVPRHTPFASPWRPPTTRRRPSRQRPVSQHMRLRQRRRLRRRRRRERVSELHAVQRLRRLRAATAR